MSDVADYAAFLSRKLARVPPTGIADPPETPDYLKPFQGDLVVWALRRGRAALFARTGLGKTRMHLRWSQVVAERTGKPHLTLTPLAVADQTRREGERIGIPVTVCRDGADVRPGINVANYERIHRFDPSVFGSVALDESGILKGFDRSTCKMLIEAFAATPFRLCASATPAPNDHAELGTHAEFLGICSRTEMLSEFFCHDGGETSVWRLKGHARRDFWRFVASWGALVRHPRDLGYDDAGYDLPPLSLHQHVVAADAATIEQSGNLFAVEARTLAEQRAARRASLGARVALCAEQVNAEASEPWVVWSDLNAESTALAESIDGAVEVYGSLDIDEKEARLRRFIDREARVLVTKPSIAGHGLNLQFCARMAFVGVTNSWESWHQAKARIHRFGQARPVDVHVYSSEAEGAVLKNLDRKERDAERMGEELSAETRDLVREAVVGQRRVRNDYQPTKGILVPAWLS